MADGHPGQRRRTKRGVMTIGLDGVITSINPAAAPLSSLRETVSWPGIYIPAGFLFDGTEKHCALSSSASEKDRGPVRLRRRGYREYAEKY